MAVEVKTVCDVKITLPLVAVITEVDSTSEVTMRVEKGLEAKLESCDPLSGDGEVIVAYEVETIGEDRRTDVVKVPPAENTVVDTVAVSKSVTYIGEVKTLGGSALVA